MIDIRHGDCLKTLQVLPDQVADAIIMDPPYPNRTPSRGQSEKAEALQSANTHGALNITGLLWLMREVTLESMRLMKPTGSLLVFCDAQMFFQMVPVIESGGPRYQDVIVWDKQHFGMGAAFRKQHELIAHFSYQTPQYHHHGTANILRCKRVSIREHSNQKPAELLEQLIRVVCPVGGTVLDPFMGIGSTGEACLTTGRNFIGIELNETHYELAERRLRMMEHQLRFSHLGSQSTSHRVAIPSQQLVERSAATTQSDTQLGSS